MDLSIIIVNYNTASVTLACIESIRKYHHKFTYEIVVVDNASKDVQVLREAFNDQDDIVLIESEENMGFAKGLNLGIAQSKGQYLVLLNSDTLFHDDCLDQMLVDYQGRSGKHVMSPKLLNEQGGGQLTYVPFPSLKLELIYLLRMHKFSVIRKSLPIDFHDDIERYFDNGYLVATLLLFDRKLLAELPGKKLYDGMFLYGEESIWFREFRRTGVKFWYNPKPAVTHFIGLSSKAVEEDFYFSRKYNQMLGERTYLRKFYTLPYRVLFFAVRLLRLSILAPFDHEIRMRLQVCRKLLKSGF